MVGYLGPIHSFTYQAASTFYMQGELLPYGNFHLLFEALDKDLVEGIVVPIENSIEGTVNVVQDKLLEYGFQINREIVMDIRLSLISKSNQNHHRKHNDLILITPQLEYLNMVLINHKIIINK